MSWLNIQPITMIIIHIHMNLFMSVLMINADNGKISIQEIK